jgi:outer membrane immunogenic protein
MKKTLAVAAFATLAGAAGTANAADMYAQGGLKDAPYVAAAPTWTGFYIGANVGGGWSQLDSSVSGTFLGITGTVNNTNEASGVVGGGQVGYNWQTGAFVLGVEADFGGFGFSRTKDVVTINSGAFAGSYGTKIESGFAADVTGRLGYAAGPALFYVKGGWAFFDGSLGLDFPSTLASFVKDTSKTGLDGWTIGGGIEYKISPAWSVKGEYQYYDFGSFDFHPILDAPKIALSNNLTANTVKVGVNYYFGNIYSPLK